MSFSLNKNSSGRIIRKSVNTGITYQSILQNTPYLASAQSTLVSNRNFEAEVPSIVLSNNTSASFTQDNLSFVENIVVGDAEPNKALILNSSKDVSDINILKCNNMIVKGVSVPTTVASGVVSAPTNDYYTDNTNGSATANKVVIPDSNLSVDSINLINGKINDGASFEKEDLNIKLFNGPSLSDIKWSDSDYSIDLKKFICVGHEKVALSENGNSWTEIDVVGVSFLKVIWGGDVGLYYAVATTGIYKSIDGNEWELDLEVLNGGVVDISIGKNKIIAIGTKMFVKIISSSTWTEINMTASMNTVAWTGVAYAPVDDIGALNNNLGRFVVVGNNKVAYCDENLVNTATNWVDAVLTGLWSSVSYGNGLFMAVNSQSQINNKFTVSSIGVNWNKSNLSWHSYDNDLVSSGFKKVKFIEGLRLFIVLIKNPRAYEQLIYYTKTGTEWYDIIHPCSNHLTSVSYSSTDGKLLLLSKGTDLEDDNNLPYSMQMKYCEMEYSDVAGTTHQIFTNVICIELADRDIIFGCNDGIYYSNNGVKFLKANNMKNGVNEFNIVSRKVYDITYSSSLQKFIACSNYSAGVYSSLMVSSDGISWTDINSSINSSCFRIIWSASHSRFYGCISNNLIYSSDGITWNTQIFTSINNISIVDNDVFLHGNHLSKRLYKLNSDLSLTATNFLTNIDLSEIVKFNGKLYGKSSTIVYVSTNEGIDWAIAFDTTAGMSDRLLVHEVAGCIVMYCSDHLIRTFKNEIVLSSTIYPNDFSYRARYSGTSGCYSKRHKCIFVAGNNTNLSIFKTREMRGLTLVSSSVYKSSKVNAKEMIYRTIPNYSKYLEELDDNIYSAFNSDILTKTLTAGAGSNGYKDMYYSRNMQTWYLLRRNLSSSLFNSYSNNNFTSTPAYTYSPTGIDVGDSLNIWFMNGITANYLTASNMTATTTTPVYTINSSYIYTASTWIYKVKKIPNTSILYDIVGGTIRFRPISFSTIGTISINTQTINVTDGCYNHRLERMVYIGTDKKVYTWDIKSSTLAEKVGEFTLPAANTYRQVEYFEEGNVFVISGNNYIAYSYDGITWTTTPSTEMLTYTYAENAMKVIKELSMIAIVMSSRFAYSYDGINWTILTTQSAQAWTAFDYNPDLSNFVLYSENNGMVMITSAVYTNMRNVIVPTSGFVSGDNISVHNQNAYVDRASPALEDKFALETNGYLNFSASSKNASWNSADTVNLNFGTNNLEFAKTDTNYSANNVMKINDKIINLNSNILESSSKFNSKENVDIVNKNSLAIIKKEVLRANNISANSLVLNQNYFNNNFGPVIANTHNDISIDKISNLNNLNINGGLISWNKEKIFNVEEENLVKASDVQLSDIYKYMNFKKTSFRLGKGALRIFGSTYSPSLNTIAIMTNAMNSTYTHMLHTSNDSGKNWRRIMLLNTDAFTNVPSEHTNKIEWIPYINKFVLVQDNSISISNDGYTWKYKSVSFGVNPTIFWDSKINRLTVSTATKRAYANDTNDLLGNWTIITTNTDIRMISYMSSIDKYFFRNATTGNLQISSDIYAETISMISSISHQAIADMCLFGEFLYYVGGNIVYRKNTNTITTGSVVFTDVNFIFKRIMVINDLDILVAFSNKGFAYSKDGIVWFKSIISNELASSIVDTSIEGIMNAMYWLGNKILYISCSDNNVLESDVYDKMGSDKITCDYLHSCLKSKMTDDVLYNTSQFQTSLFLRHSTTNYNLWATACGNGYFLSVGDNVHMFADSLKKNQIVETHTGNWVDIVYCNNRFIKIKNGGIAHRDNNLQNTGTEEWTYIELSGSWSKIVNYGKHIIIFSDDSNTIMYANDINSGWLEINTPSTVSTTVWNNISICNDKLFLLGNDYIAYKSISTDGFVIDISEGWAVKNIFMNCNDITYAKNLYVIAGNGFIGRSRDLISFRKTFVSRNYHKVIYVRLYSDFFLMSKDYNNAYGSTVSSIQLRMGQSNGVIRTNDGVQWYSSFKVNAHTDTVLKYKLSNLYYFEETDQFALPLNNTTNKIYAYSNYTIANQSDIKITTQSAFKTDTTIDIGRGTNLTTVSPALFNVFTDSAAKPATSTWTITSDVRAKENIQSADLELCTDNIKKLDLKYYKWKDEFITKEQSADRHRLGWIAQDVEKVIPKAVKTSNMFNNIGVENAKMVDSDQIIANLYGAVKLLSKKLKEKEQALKDAKE